MDDNNALLEQIAGVAANSGYTNNQLLQMIVEQGGGGGGGGGESSYDAIVPSEDYPTLEAAVAAEKTNIFLKAGAHEVSADIVIDGATTITGVFGQTIVLLGDFSLTANVAIDLSGIYFSTDNGYVRVNGDNSLIERCAFLKSDTGTGSVLRINALNSIVSKNIFLQLNEVQNSAFLEVWKANNWIDKNIFQLREVGNTIAKAAISLTGSPYSTHVTGNRILTNGVDSWSSDCIVIGLTHADLVIDGNYIENGSPGGTAIVTEDYDLVITNNRIYSMLYAFRAINGSAQYRRTYKITNNLIMNGLVTPGGFHDSLIANNYISHTIPWTLSGIEAVVISGNEIRNIGLTLDTDSSDCIVVNNDVYNSVNGYPNTIVDNGTDNVVTPNITGRTV